MKISTTFNLGLRGIAVVIVAMVSMTLLIACGDSSDSDAIAGVMENVSRQSAEIQALGAQVGNLQSELAEARKMEADNAADLRAGIDELRGQDKMSAEFDDSELTSEIGELRDAITKLEGRINSIEHEGEDTEAFGEDLAALNDAVEDLQERLDSDDEDGERINVEHIESLNAELSSVLAALTELQGSGTTPQMEEVIARLDWLENAVAPSYTRAYVEEAILRYNREGRQATVDYYNTMASVSGDLYLFILDEDYKMIAHPTVPGNIGMDIRGPLGTDITGKNFGAEFVTVDGKGKWIDYVSLNPAANYTFERKHAWIVRHDNLIFGSGWYERTVSFQSTPADYARALVVQAIARYDGIGKDTVLSYYNSPASVHGQYYVFAVDADDLSGIANANLPDYVGRTPARIDPTGYYYGGDLGSATEEGKWISYVIRNPETGVSQRKHTWVALHDGIIWGSGWYEPITSLKDEPALYVRSLVDDAIERYEAEGLDATVEYYNSDESVDGQYYVFIAGENDVMIAHATIPSNVGKLPDEIISPDGYPAGAQVAAAAVEDGAWTSYTYLNPSTGNVQTKHSWVIRHEGLVFGSGWYEEGTPKSDAAAYTQAFVERAINLYDDLGLEGTLEYYNSPESLDGQWYVFIGDENDVMIAHAAVPENVGMPFDDIISPTDGYPAGAQAAAAAVEGGAWTTYTYLNASTGNVETKHSWVTRHDGMIFGSGWYEEGPSKDEPDAYTKAFVERAINLYDDLGLEGTLEYYNSEDSVDGQWYLGIIDEDGINIAHYDDNVRGKSLHGDLGTDITGYNFGAEIVNVTEDGKWISYVYNNPATGELGSKHSWVVLHDGMLFGAGWYTEPADYTQHLVGKAIDMYKAEGREATLEHYNDPATVDGQWYVYIIDADSKVSLANAARPEFVGAPPTHRIDPTGYDYGEALYSATEEGKWISYIIKNPATEEQRRKHAWIVRHDDLFFGAGWYEDVE